MWLASLGHLETEFAATARQLIEKSPFVVSPSQHVARKFKRNLYELNQLAGKKKKEIVKYDIDNISS